MARVDDFTSHCNRAKSPVAMITISASTSDVRAGDQASISVIIPTYNCAAYVRRAVESCLEQDSEVAEIIVVDDGSTDRTPDVLTTFADRPKVRVIRQTNAGISRARNAGVAASRGTHLCFLDADDELLPDALRRRRLAADAHPEIDFFFSDYLISSVPGSMRSAFASLGGLHALSRWFVNSEDGFALLIPEFRQAYEDSSVNRAFAWTIAVTLRRTLFDAVGGFDPSLRVAEDQDLWRRCLFAGRAAVILGSPSAIYFKWRGSPEKYRLAAEEVIAGLRAELHRCPVFSKEWFALRRRIAREWISVIHGLGMARTPKLQTLQHLIASIRSFPLPALQSKYLVLVLTPKPLLNLLYRIRDGRVGHRDP